MVPLSVEPERKLVDLQRLQLSFVRKLCLSLQVVVGLFLILVIAFGNLLNLR